MITWRMGSRGEIYIPFGGPLGENINPPKYSGVVYQSTRIKNVINFINISENFCHKLATKTILLLAESRRIFSQILD